MPQNDLLKRYIDAGLSFGALTQSRAEALVSDWVKAGELQADQAREAVADLLARSRETTERLLATVRKEVQAQVISMGLASQADLDRLEERIGGLVESVTTPSHQAVELAKQAAAPAKDAVAKAAESASQAARKAAGTTKKATKKATQKSAPATKAATKKKAAKKAAPAKRKAATKAAPAKKRAAAKKA
jgi:polyhydroxyalkanoate synthesis regulator phasin